MAKLPFMMGRYKWLVKVLSVGAECKGEDPSAERKKPTSTKQQHTTAVNGPLKKNGEKNEEHKVFNDPIHGHIALHPVLVKIIDTPEFQRLRNISQLGAIYFVYPGASHNRFEHSIGVAHLAGELTRALKMKQEKQIKQLTEKLTIFQRICLSFGFTKLENLKKLEDLNKSLISDQDILCVQIAGLCHDLGHGPFSHFFDGIFMKAIEREKKDKEVQELENSLTSWKHEEASIRMLDKLLENNSLKGEMEKYGLKVDGKDKTDLVFIKEMIFGHLPDEDSKPQIDDAHDNGPQNNDPSKNKWQYKGREEKKSFLYEIVSNKETKIDVDKFDYFARDCHHLGIPNSFDHQRFIMFARVCDVEEDGRKHICSRDKEVANLYDIFHQRLSIHRRACQHKIKMAIDIMIKDALLLVNKHPDFKIQDSKGKMIPLSEAYNDMVAYMQLTDLVIEKIFNFPHSKKSQDLEEASRILQRVMTRDLYRCVGQAKKNFEEEVKERLKTLVKKSHDGKDGNEFTDVTLSYTMKNKNCISKKYHYDKNKADEENSENDSESISEAQTGNQGQCKENNNKKNFEEEVKKTLIKLVKDIQMHGKDREKVTDVTLSYTMKNKNCISKKYHYDKNKADEENSEDKKKEKKKNLEKIKNDLEKKLREHFPKEKFEVIDVTLDYGMENVDPISKAYFYRKDNPDKGEPINKSDVFSVLPDWFSDEILRVYWKNPENLKKEDILEKEELFKEFFKKWCMDNGYKDLNKDDTSTASGATPGNEQSN